MNRKHNGAMNRERRDEEKKEERRRDGIPVLFTDVRHEKFIWSVFFDLESGSVDITITTGDVLFFVRVGLVFASLMIVTE